MDHTFNWHAVVPRTKRTLNLSRDYLTSCGVTRDEKLMSVVFDYHEPIVEKLLRWDPSSRAWTSCFFNNGVALALDAGGNFVFKERIAV